MGRERAKRASGLKAKAKMGNHRNFARL
jgi:hypothetical protein